MRWVTESRAKKGASAEGREWLKTESVLTPNPQQIGQPVGILKARPRKDEVISILKRFSAPGVPDYVSREPKELDELREMGLRAWLYSYSIVLKFGCRAGTLNDNDLINCIGPASPNSTSLVREYKGRGIEASLVRKRRGLDVVTIKASREFDFGNEQFAQFLGLAFTAIVEVDDSMASPILGSSQGEIVSGRRNRADKPTKGSSRHASRVGVHKGASSAPRVRLEKPDAVVPDVRDTEEEVLGERTRCDVRDANVDIDYDYDYKDEAEEILTLQLRQARLAPRAHRRRKVGKRG